MMIYRLPKPGDVYQTTQGELIEVVGVNKPNSLIHCRYGPNFGSQVNLTINQWWRDLHSEYMTLVSEGIQSS